MIYVDIKTFWLPDGFELLFGDDWFDGCLPFIGLCCIGAEEFEFISDFFFWCDSKQIPIFLWFIKIENYCFKKKLIY